MTGLKDRLSEATVGRLPLDLLSLLQILDNSKEPIRTRIELLSVVLHRLMLEVGFLVVAKGNSPVDENQVLVVPNEPLKAMSAGHKFSYAVDGDRGRCWLQVIPIGQSVVVKGIFAGEPPATFSMPSKLNPSDYVADKDVEPTAARFKDLKVLSRAFKNSVALPLLSHAKETLSLPAGPESMRCLPEEMMLEVFSHMDDARSILKLGECCKAFQLLSRNQSNWKRLFRNHYPDVYASMSDEDKNSEEFDWMSHYKKKKERGRILSRSSTRETGWPRRQDPHPPAPGQGPFARPRRGNIPDRFRPRFDPPYPDYM